MLAATALFSSAVLPEASLYDVILEQRKRRGLGQALTGATEAFEKHFTPLAGQLSKDYERDTCELRPVS
jgi:type I restriction enzyme M protein